MGCNTVSMTFEDLQKEKAAQIKIKEIQNFDNANLINVTKSSDSQKINNKEIEDCKRKVVDLKIQTAALTERVEELKVEKETLRKNLDAKKSRLNVLKKEVEKNKINQDNELKEFSDNHTKNMKELNTELRGKIEEAEKRFTESSSKTNGFKKYPNEHLSSLKPENLVVECEPIEHEDRIQCSPQSYLGEISVKLQANMYFLVLPEQFAEDCPYKVKDIVEDINDEDLLDEKERKEASKRWEDLKTEIQWDSSLVRTLKLLQNARDSMDEPPRLDLDEAKNVAETLNKHGKLKGRISYASVQKIIEMWSKSSRLIANRNL